MKRVALWLFLMCVLWVAGASTSAAATEPVGKVDLLSGTVSVEREGRNLPARTGDPVYLQDKWQTRGGSSMEILFLDNSRVKMAPDTILEITEYLYNPSQKTRKTLLSMVSGKARFLVQDLQDFKEKRFRVRTQTAVVGTRDTDYIVNVRPEAQTQDLCNETLTEAFCVENAVHFSTWDEPDKRVILTANMLSRICGNAPPSPPRFATAEERLRLIRGVEQIGSKTESAPGAAAVAHEETQALPPDFPSSDIQIPGPTQPAGPTVPPPTIPGEPGADVPGIRIPPPFVKPTGPKPLPPPPPPPAG